MKEKITTGANDRPKNETLAQTGEGLPDDSGSIIDVDSEEAATIRSKLEADQEAGERASSVARDQGGKGMPGAEEVTGAGAEEDTYD